MKTLFQKRAECRKAVYPAKTAEPNVFRAHAFRSRQRGLEMVIFGSVVSGQRRRAAHPWACSSRLC